MRYTLTLHFVTDGDYGFRLIPPETKFDGEDYCLDKVFCSFSDLRKYLNNVIPDFLDNIDGRDWEVNTVKEKLSALLDNINGENGESAYYDCMSGNQDGTEFSYSPHAYLVPFNIRMDDELFQKYRQSGLTTSQVKDLIIEKINQLLAEKEG